MYSFLPGEAWALLAALVWSFAVILYKKAGESVPPLPYSLFKNVVVLVALVPIALLEGPLVPDLSGETWLRLVVSGVVGVTLSDTLFFMALNRLGAGLNAIVDCFYSPSLLLLAFLFLGERLPISAWIGAALVVSAIGLAVEARPIPGRTHRDVVHGVLFGVLGMICIAVSVVAIKDTLQPERVFWIGAFRLLAGTVFLLPLFFRARDREALRRIFRPSRTWRYAVPGAVLGSGIAMMIWLVGMTMADVSVNAVLNQLSTIFIFVLAALLLGEPVTRRRLVGVALAFAGTLLVVLR